MIDICMENNYSVKNKFIPSKGSSFNMLSTISVIYNLAVYAGFGYQTFDA